MIIPTVPHGQPIPYKVWMKAMDVLADYHRAGEALIASSSGEITDDFLKAEAEYNQMADAIWFAKWTKEQRDEWERISNKTNNSEV